MVTNISRSPAETLALGENWGRAAQPGTVIALCGDLGAGKTQLVKGLALGLGIAARVTSPTFALVNVYEHGRLPLFHLDLYRLETPEAVRTAGLEEYFSPKGVTVIEWADRWFVDGPPGGLPGTSERQGEGLFRWVNLEVLNESGRRISYEDFGA
jgi:tRNA threonylcarbamoyladenosine biosynthesis protein TsaE